MYKSTLCHTKYEKKNYNTKKEYNFLSPSNNQKIKQKQFLNGNIPKCRPVNLYSTYLSPSQNEKTFSVKNVISPDEKLSQDLLNKFSNNQKNLNEKMFQSPNTTNSDLLTVASLTTQQSNESILSNTTNTNTFVSTKYPPMLNNYVVCQFSNHRYNYSISNYPQMNYFYPNTNNPFINGNYSTMTMKYNNRQSFNINNNQKKNNQNTISNNNNNNKFKKNSDGNYVKKKSNSNYDNDEKIDVSNFNSNNSIKSGSGSEKSNTNSSKNSSKNNKSTKSDVTNKKNDKKNNLNNCGNGNNQRKKYYNKFNSSNENNITNENTVILTLKIKVAPNDFRTFNLKKYDDLFISLEKFFDLNKIKQDLVKPIVTKIFAALNKIFWLLNNKIGIYDLEYLSSLHKLWVKNNGQIPKRKDSKDEDIKNNDNNNGRNNKNKANSDKSTISSSDSSDGDKKHKKIMSNSFQNMNNISEDDGKEDTANSI